MTASAEGSAACTLGLPDGLQPANSSNWLLSALATRSWPRSVAPKGTLTHGLTSSGFKTAV